MNGTKTLLTTVSIVLMVVFALFAYAMDNSKDAQTEAKAVAVDLNGAIQKVTTNTANITNMQRDIDEIKGDVKLILKAVNNGL